MKRKTAIRIVIIFLCTCFLSGCRQKAEYPFYRMETLADNTEILTIDGVLYRRDWNDNERAMYYNGGDVWTLAYGLGQQIGICGEEDSSSEFDIYAAAGDDELKVLYTSPHNFYFGGTYVRLWLREDVSLGPPTAEMVSCITVVWNNDDMESKQTDDPDLIAALVNAYGSSSEQAAELPPRGRTGYKLILHHADYPFLQYEIHCCYSLEQGAAYCQNDDLEWFALPGEWMEVLGL